MITGVLWALLAGIMLGLYAVPAKFTRDFKFENTWGAFFVLTCFVVPLIATALLMKDAVGVFSQMPGQKLLAMCLASFAWGCGVMMWGKAITYIGVSLGFSLFIGTVIAIGSLWPLVLAVMEKGIAGLPPAPALAATLAGIAVVLVGVYANGAAGMLRERDEKAQSAEAQSQQTPTTGGASMARGIFIAVFGGLLATGFSIANTVSKPELPNLTVAAGNPPWVSALAIMLPIFLSGGVVMTCYFAWQLTKNKSWNYFASPYLIPNLVLIFIMAFFHYAASAVFAYAAYLLGGKLGDTIGYAIFNTTCVAVAVVSGLVTGEWKKASSTARARLYLGLVAMIAGILLLAAGNFMRAA